MSDSGDVAIRVRDLTVVRGRRPVVDTVGFDVRTGDIVGLIGPSGCGKSTLMRSLVGVQENVSGTCDVLGCAAGSEALRTRVGYMTQTASVYGDLTVRENLRYFRKVLGASLKRVDEVLELVDLGDHGDRLVNSLSGGQHNRVSLAVVLLGRPELLILDEPTVGLDPVLRRDLWGQFRGLSEAGTTLLVSSHVMEEASACHRILLMREGRLLADDTEEALLRRTGAGDLTAAFLTLVDADADADVDARPAGDRDA